MGSRIETARKKCLARTERNHRRAQQIRSFSMKRKALYIIIGFLLGCPTGLSIMTIIETKIHFDSSLGMAMACYLIFYLAIKESVRRIFNEQTGNLAAISFLLGCCAGTIFVLLLPKPWEVFQWI